MANPQPITRDEGQQSPVESATSALHREVNLLHEVVDALEIRLSTVLKSEGHAPGKSAANANANLQPVAHRVSERVASSSADVERARARLNQVLNLLEV